MTRRLAIELCFRPNGAADVWAAVLQAIRTAEPRLVPRLLERPGEASDQEWNDSSWNEIAQVCAGEPGHTRNLVCDAGTLRVACRDDELRLSLILLFQGRARLDRIPPIFYFDRTALAPFGGLESVRTRAPGELRDIPGGLLFVARTTLWSRKTRDDLEREKAFQSFFQITSRTPLALATHDHSATDAGDPPWNLVQELPWSDDDDVTTNLARRRRRQVDRRRARHDHAPRRLAVEHRGLEHQRGSVRSRRARRNERMGRWSRGNDRALGWTRVDGGREPDDETTHRCLGERGGSRVRSGCAHDRARHTGVTRTKNPTNRVSEYSRARSTAGSRSSGKPNACASRATEPHALGEFVPYAGSLGNLPGSIKWRLL